MRFVQRVKELPLPLPDRAVSIPPSQTCTARRTERSGSFGGYAVSGWRYVDLAIWHLTVWSISDDKPGQTYVVLAGEFYPESVSPAEKFAALRLIAFWEADGGG
jgi:hypothetical protein